MEEERRQLVPAADALVEVPADKQPLRRLSRFAISTAQREIHGGALHRTALPPTLQGFFFASHVDEFGHTDHEEGPPPLPMKRYGQFANLLAMSAAPLVDVDPTFSFITGALPAVDHIYLLDSCNGLLLFGHLEDALSLNTMETCFIVCNPVTEEWVDVPSCHRIDMFRLPKSSVMHAYLLFEPAVSSHFHIVLFVPVIRGPVTSTIIAQAYSSETGEWSTEYNWSIQERCASLERWRLFHIGNVSKNVDFGSPGAVLNGMLYLIYARKWILQVDAQAKSRLLMPAPGVQHEVLDFSSNRILFIGQSQGCLHCIIQEGHHEELVQLNPALEMGSVDGVTKWMYHGLSVWVLKNHDTQEWVLKGRVSYQQLLGKNSCDGNFEYRVAALHPDCNMIFFRDLDCNIISYDIDHQEVCSLNTNIQNSIGNITAYAPYLSGLFVGEI